MTKKNSNYVTQNVSISNSNDVKIGNIENNMNRGQSDSKDSFANFKQEKKHLDIYHILKNHFDLEELKLLSFNLGITFENLKGQKLDSKAMELVLHMHRLNRIDDLIQEINKVRPKIKL